MYCTVHQILLDRSKQVGWERQAMWQVSRINEVHRRLLWDSLKEEDHLKDLDLNGNIILKGMFTKYLEWDAAA